MSNAIVQEQALPGAAQVNPVYRFQRRWGFAAAFRGERAKEATMIDVTKLKSQIDAVRKSVQDQITATAQAAAKDPLGVKGIAALCKAGEKLEQANDALDVAAEKSTAKVKEVKADKKK